MKEINKIIKKYSIEEGLTSFYPESVKGRLVIISNNEYLHCGCVLTDKPNTLYRELKKIPSVDTVGYFIE